MDFDGIAKLAEKACDGVDELRRLKPNITLIGEGNPDPTKQRASVRLEFYGPDSFEKSRQAHLAILAVIGS